MPTNVLRPSSPGEELFALHCKSYGLSPVREFLFAPGRKYRFDFAWPDRNMAVEIEGGTRGKSRHTSHTGYQEDCRKYNLATLLGWSVFRFTTAQVKSAEAIDFIMKVMQ